MSTVVPGGDEPRGKATRSPKPRKPTPEEEARFARASAEFVAATLAKEVALGIGEVTKSQIVYVLGRGFSAGSVDRRRKEPDFPKPIDDTAHILKWRIRDLLNYQKKKQGE
jgi:hypothetical protein